ncbi:AbrB/MazE/SpoVT family DNA-binding domain-containing protein [Sporosarcina sp. FSL W7-1349]|uniref:AbrB/MazE/SpoVT family DNA-binding domain-containing protein n=2 Tax=Sporosarcina sp. FSL W7-1349 TaxID=2921561 RepID=UPI0030F8F605
MNPRKQLETKTTQSKGADYMATVTVQKWGNSLGIRIPKEVADWIGIDQGSELELHVSGRESITLKPKRPRKKYTLEELLAQITPENRHEEIDFETEGREYL